MAKITSFQEAIMEKVSKLADEIKDVKTVQNKLVE